MDEWRWMTAADLGRGIGAGRIDPVELTESYLAAMKAEVATPRIYARATADRARAEAGAARERAKAGLRRGPLDGVPVSWKDLFDTAGVATEAGTALMAGRVPERDARVLATATANGLVCLGKTHMSEIAFSGLGYNPVTATPPNVFDVERVPGGSSSGAAASVAFGLAPAAIGSDTGGSIRVPSAWNGLVGFKPAHGALPLEGSVPLCARFDTVGPLARSVEDAALLWTALGGPKVDLAGAGLDGLTLIVAETVVMEDLEEAPATAFEAALDTLSAAGVRVTRAKMPWLARAYELSAALYTAEAWAFWRPYVEPAPEKMFSQIRERVSAGATVPAHEWIAGWDELRAMRRRFAEETAGASAVACPTVALLPPKVDRLTSDDAYYKAANLRTLRNTRLANLMGLASVSLPLAPMTGLMLSAQPGREAGLLRNAVAVARALA